MRKQFDFSNKLYVITQSDLSKEDNYETVKKAIAGGAGIIQLREKNWSKEQITEEAQRLLPLCKENNVLFIVNDHVDVALETGADGVHLGQEDMSVAEARKLVGDKLLIGLSTHSTKQALAADKEDVDYFAIGPLFKTNTKDYFIGAETIDLFLGKVSKPVVGIGGIQKNNINQVLKKGINTIAVISAVVAADDVEDAAFQLVKQIRNVSANTV